MPVDKTDFQTKHRKDGRKEKLYRHFCNKCGLDKGYIVFSKIDGISSADRPCKKCRDKVVGLATKGRIPHNKGKPISEKVRQKLRKANLGKSPTNRGQSVSEETKIKISCKVRGISLEEFDDFGWKQDSIRKQKFNTDLRKMCFELADYTCDCCSKRGVALNAHHLYDYANHPQLLNELTNLVCLCETCHKEFHVKYGRTLRNKKILNTKEQYIEFKEYKYVNQQMDV